MMICELFPILVLRTDIILILIEKVSDHCLTFTFSHHEYIRCTDVTSSVNLIHVYTYI